MALLFTHDMLWVFGIVSFVSTEFGPSVVRAARQWSPSSPLPSHSVSQTERHPKQRPSGKLTTCTTIPSGLPLVLTPHMAVVLFLWSLPSGVSGFQLSSCPTFQQMCLYSPLFAPGRSGAPACPWAVSLSSVAHAVPFASPYATPKDLVDHRSRDEIKSQRMREIIQGLRLDLHEKTALLSQADVCTRACVRARGTGWRAE